MRTNESRIRHAIRQRHAATISFSETALQLCHEVQERLCAKEVHERQERSKAIAVGLCTKLCKQFRAIIVLSELGLVEDAQVVTRSFFESVLNTLFVLKRRVVLRRGWKTAPARPRGGYSMEFRVEVYIARSALDERKRVNVWQQTPGCKRVGKRLAPLVDQTIAWCEGHLGKAWMAWLAAPKLSGDAFKVERMSQNLGLGKWYAVVYRPQSSIAHAADAMSHMDADSQPMTIDVRIGPDIDGAAAPLRLANALVGVSMEKVNDRFHLGLDSEIRDLATEWSRILANS